MMMIIYSEFPLLGKLFSCLRCRVVTRRRHLIAQSTRVNVGHDMNINDGNCATPHHIIPNINKAHGLVCFEQPH
jgi:hypothetical protein